MSKLLHSLRYLWPLHFILLFSNWLPDNIIFLRLRGTLARPFFGSCGTDLRLGRNVTFYNPENLHIGDHVYIAYGAWAAGKAEVYIGDEVMLGPYCIIASGQHTRLGKSYRYGEPVDKPIHIGSGSWIAAHVVISGGACIGRGCLVGANSVVTDQTLPDNSFCGGIPVRVIQGHDPGYEPEAAA